MSGRLHDVEMSLSGISEFQAIATLCSVNTSFWSFELWSGDFSVRVLEVSGFCVTLTGSSSVSVATEMENTPHLIKQVQQRIKNKDCIHV